VLVTRRLARLSGFEGRGGEGGRVAFPVEERQLQAEVLTMRITVARRRAASGGTVQ